jgi:putative CocE/NonD family hydrolase
MGGRRSRPRALRVDRALRVEMRDGTVTYADVYRPASRGRSPVILQRTPYGRSVATLALAQLDLLRAVDRGYAVVVQDCRGRHASQGEFRPFHQERSDGYDSVEWCARQPWSTGDVGMIGASYSGAVQWLAAVEAPPSLRCIVPVLTSSDHYEGWTYQSGALQWGFVVSWLYSMLASEALVNRRFQTSGADDTRRRLIGLLDDLAGSWNTLPLRDLPLVGELAPYFLDWIAHPTRDAYWRAVSVQDRYDRVQVPALNVGGWYDIFRDGTLTNFVGLRSGGASVAARSGTRLIMGPWVHSSPTTQSAGVIDFGVRSSHGWTPLHYDLDGEYLAFFDRWLQGTPPRGATSGGEDSPIRLFTMGENRWRNEEAWPLGRAIEQRLYLHSTGAAGRTATNGQLNGNEPTSEAPDSFLYDPADPVPTLGGQLCCYAAQYAPGAFDQRPVEARDDVLVFTTEALERETEVTGPILVNLWAATSAPETDFTAKLVAVAPDGLALNLTDGIARARFVRGADAGRPIAVGEPMEYVVDLGATSYLFRAGYQIRLEISSSNFPRFDRNLNTGHSLGADAVMRSARQTVFHDAGRGSYLTLPVVPP